MSQNSDVGPTSDPWRALTSIADVELWVAEYDSALQQLIGKSHTFGHGVCFTFEAGGQLYLHTNGDGDILLDLDFEAAWITPVIIAATGVTQPAGQIWILPGNLLTQLIFGLNPLIAHSSLVLYHRFR